MSALPKVAGDGEAVAGGALLTRRRILAAGVGIAGAAMGGRALWRWNGRGQCAIKLQRSAQQVLAAQNQVQLAQLPRRASERVKAFFDGVCLNLNRFTSKVCSDVFAEKLRACGSPEGQRLLLNAEFSSELVSPIVICIEVRKIVEEVGANLDRDWTKSCQDVADKWDAIMKERGRSWASHLQGQLDPLIFSEICKARALSHALDNRMAIGETTLRVGTEAIKLLPVVPFLGPKLSVPAFIAAALSPLWQLIWGRLAHREHGYREAISEHLSSFAMRVARQCEIAFEERIAQLHAWQQASISRVSCDLARESFSLFV